MEPILGQVQTFGFNFAPRGWALCNGALLAIAQNTALFSLLGTAFGGDGRTTFALPDLRGRSIVGAGHGAGLSNISWGQRGGGEYVTLGIVNLPSHGHAIQVPVNGQDGTNTDDPINGYLGNTGGNSYNTAPTTGEHLGSFNSGNTGGGQAFGIRDPYLGMYVCIATVGLFPSRN